MPRQPQRVCRRRCRFHGEKIRSFLSIYKMQWTLCGFELWIAPIAWLKVERL